MYYSAHRRGEHPCARVNQPDIHANAGQGCSRDRLPSGVAGCDSNIHRIAILEAHIQVDRGAWWGVENVSGSHMSVGWRRAADAGVCGGRVARGRRNPTT